MSEAPSPVQRTQIRLAARCGLSTPTIIDIGCANGSFLHHACNAGIGSPGSYGVEVSEVNATAARTAGLRVETELAEVPRGSLATFWHSAEHLPVPTWVEMLRAIRERSEGTASVLLAVPNGDSPQARLFGSRWAFHDERTHLSAFTRRSLALALGHGGFIPVRWFRTPVYGLFSAVQSSINLFRPHNRLYESRQRGTVGLANIQVMADLAIGAALSPLIAATSVPELVATQASVLTVFARPCP